MPYAQSLHNTNILNYYTNGNTAPELEKDLSWLNCFSPYIRKWLDCHQLKSFGWTCYSQLCFQWNKTRYVKIVGKFLFSFTVRITLNSLTCNTHFSECLFTLQSTMVWVICTPARNSEPQLILPSVSIFFSLPTCCNIVFLL